MADHHNDLGSRFPAEWKPWLTFGGPARFKRQPRFPIGTETTPEVVNEIEVVNEMVR